ncbi:MULTISPECIES: hypothetical protein [Bacillus cereus group]|uniref:Uncharacterized protein n=2 Tax=Bacillus TaxID=1386 RepID=A0A9W7QEE5_BACCE|nr:hypothetical protein [Bacillus cereus]KAB2393444.1 hypothetical protein F8172_16795 [Bacillus cereus]KAB2408172.1 hypothetical protein F8170_09715 [Bacillus cereus]KAB2429161.1 hypothetical protein F8168_14610 [Bacillus cereus]
MNLHYRKNSILTSTPHFPHINLSGLPEVTRISSCFPKTPKTKKTPKFLKSRTLCFRQLIEHKIQLVPPAKKGTIKVDRQIFTTIEKVCSEVVTISGFIRKTITYTALAYNKIIPNYRILGDVPFQGLIESKDIKEDHQFSIIEEKILSNVYTREANFENPKKSQVYKSPFAFNFIETDAVKVSIKMSTE